MGLHLHNWLEAHVLRREAEALILATEWKEFHRVDLEQVRRVMHTPIVFDGRNFFDPETMKEVGFKYYGIGR